MKFEIIVIVASDALTIAQQPDSAESRKMPDAAIAAVETAKILAIPEIAPFLVNICSSAFSLTLSQEWRRKMVNSNEQ